MKLLQLIQDKGREIIKLQPKDVIKSMIGENKLNSEEDKTKAFDLLINFFMARDASRRHRDSVPLSMKLKESLSSINLSEPESKTEIGKIKEETLKIVLQIWLSNAVEFTLILGNKNYLTKMAKDRIEEILGLIISEA